MNVSSKSEPITFSIKLILSIIVPDETFFSIVSAFKFATIPAVKAANVYKIVSFPEPPLIVFCDAFPLIVSFPLVPTTFSIDVIVSVLTTTFEALLFLICDVPAVKSISP